MWTHSALGYAPKWFPAPESVMPPRPRLAIRSEAVREAHACDQIVRAVIQTHSHASDLLRPSREQVTVLRWTLRISCHGRLRARIHHGRLDLFLAVRFTMPLERP